MSKNLINSNSKTYIKKILPKNASKISETPSILFSERISNINDSTQSRKFHKISRSISTVFNNNSSSFKQDKNINPLNSIFNNTYFPSSYKNKNYIKEVKNCLPPIITNNDYFSSKYLITDYESCINKFNNMYKNNGDELENSKDSIQEDINHEIKKNKVDFKESLYIDKVLKDNQKQNLFVNLRSKEEFTSPKNSLLTLKINKSLLKNMSESLSKYQYQTFANKINERQTYKLKLCLMPRPNIKELKYHYELNRQREIESKKNSILKDGSNKIVTLDKDLINKITKKYTDNKAGMDILNEKNLNLNNKKSKTEIYLKITDENIPERDKKNTISSTLIRNELILDVHLYYCKYLKIFMNPNSRMEATFTPYLNSLFLFGGLQTNEISDLWEFDVSKNFTWKKKNFENEIHFNPRYGHTTVLFNDCLYIYGGKLNLKKLKFPLEDILVYNISTNVMKIGNFKNEKNILSQKYLNIPPRRNHIAHVIGWNMIVHGGIDISKENIRENQQDYFMNDNYNLKRNMDVKMNENLYSHILGDFMALDLGTFKWIKLTNIVVKNKNNKKLFQFKSLPRVYHSSCLVLSSEHIIQGNKLNIYKNDIKYATNDYIQKGNETKNYFDIKYEGIYIFGGLNENFKETNNLYILHCFRNPLVLFEPKINGKPPCPRQLACMNFNKILNFVTIYGGKNINGVFGDLYILDIMNFQWINVGLFGALTPKGIMGHCAGIINDKLYIFGGCDENNRYIQSKLLCVELDLFRNKKLTKIYDYALAVLAENPEDKTAKNVIGLIKEGVDLPPDIYPFLQLDN